MARKGPYKKGDKPYVRSAHRGYDCYACGPTDSKGYIVCRLRRHRVAHLPDDQRAMLPNVMHWPVRDHIAAKELIDVVLDRNIDQMIEWKRLYETGSTASATPLGYDEYLAWCIEESEDGGDEHKRVAKLPVGDPIARDVITSINLGNYRVDFHILRYWPADAWGQLTFYIRLDTGRPSVLSRYLVDLATSEEHLVEHYPGRWRALGMTLPTGCDVLARHAASLQLMMAPPKNAKKGPPGQAVPGRRAQAVN